MSRRSHVAFFFVCLLAVIVGAGPVKLLLPVASAQDVAEADSTAAASEKTRPTVAVVLGGGAARGISHIGLLKALEEEGIPVDVVVGSSMGSIVSGLYAAGFSTDNLATLAREVEFTSLFTLYVPPRGAVLNPDPFEKFLHHLTGGAQVEDLQRPFYTVVTDIVSGDELVVESGSLAKALVASMSIPGIFPPVPIDGRYYVDGGMKNAVPANVARDRGADVIIAVDVKKELEHIDHNNLLTNLQLTLYFLIEGYVDLHIQHADVVIVPDVQYDSYMDFSSAEYFIHQGYAAAKKAMPEIRRAILARDPDFPFGATVPQQGLPEDVFRERLEAALKAAQRSRSGVRLALRPSLEPGFRLESSLEYYWATDLAQFHVAWDHTHDRSNALSYTGVRAGVGSCDASCAALYLRRYRELQQSAAGVVAKLPLTPSTHVALQAERPASLPHPWRISLTTRLGTAPQEVERTYSVEVGVANPSLDPAGGSGTYLRLAPVWRIPLSRSGAAVWEVAQVYPSLLLGGSATAYAEEGNTWHLKPGIGLALETRLFGLHPVRSRIWVEYDVTQKAWQWRVVFAE